jgi:hypothetical protein
MTIFFNILTHILIIAGLLSMVFYLILFIKKKFKEHEVEGLILIGTIVFAFFVYFASIALNISVPEMLFEGLKLSMPFSFKIFLGSILTSLVGILLSWFITTQLKKNQTFGVRIIILFFTLMTITFGDVYVKTFEIKNTNGYDITLLPNVSFIIGILGYIIFKYRPEKS